MELTNQQKLHQEIATKAVNDLKFKEELIKNPRETIENYLGRKLDLPDDKTLEVVDYSDESKYYFEIPKPKMITDETELTDAELELVAGGAIPPKGFWIVSCYSGCDGNFGNGLPKL